MTGAIFNYPLILIFFALGFDFVGKVFAGDEEKYQVCQTQEKQYETPEGNCDDDTDAFEQQTRIAKETDTTYD